MSEFLSPALEDKLKTCRKLPSPPAYALQVIKLANDPDVEIAKAVQVLAMDPAIVSKILRVANSPLYAHQRNVENLQVAVLLLGLSATTSLALSFSLLNGLGKQEEAGALDYALYWKRTGLAAAASRVLGKWAGIRDLEELFIASLLQDIGMLALDRVDPALYADPTLIQRSHRMVVAHEQGRLGTDHATVGGWLLDQWQFPARLQLGVALSETSAAYPGTPEWSTFIRGVAASGLVADWLLNPGGEPTLTQVSETLHAWLGLSPEQVPELLSEMTPVIHEVEQWFEMNISDDVNLEDLLDMAREGQVQHTLQVCQENDQLKRGTMMLETQYDQLEQTSQRDGLTGVFNRAFLDEYLGKTFLQAGRDGKPITIGFIDLDHFKSINDRFGHAAGDQVLKAAAEFLQKQVRASDFVGRYGGEEFVVVLPGTSASGAQEVFSRILEGFRRTTHEVGTGHSITVTASIGSATHVLDHPFPDVQTWVKTADHRVYMAKSKGRDQCVMDGDRPLAPVKKGSR